MRIEINAIVNGRPAYCVIEQAEVRWHLSDATAQTPANVLPETIHRLDLVDEGGKRVTLPATPP